MGVGKGAGLAEEAGGAEATGEVAGAVVEAPPEGVATVVIDEAVADAVGVAELVAPQTGAAPLILEITQEEASSVYFSK